MVELLILVESLPFKGEVPSLRGGGVPIPLPFRKELQRLAQHFLAAELIRIGNLLQHRHNLTIAIA